MIGEIFEHFLVYRIFEQHKGLCRLVASVTQIAIRSFIIKIVLAVFHLKVCVGLLEVAVQLESYGSNKGISGFLRCY